MNTVNSLPEAIVFDFDGIIVNSEPVHYDAYQAVLTPLGLGFTWEDYEELYMGFDDRDAFREVFKRAGRKFNEAEIAELVAKKAAIFPSLSVNAEPFPGVVELIQAASRETKVGLCSGALRSDIEPVAARLGITTCFQTIVTADDVAASKPDPSCYKLALKNLGVKNPAHCVAIEDTPAGIAAAKGARMNVLAVTNSHPAHHLLDATATVDTLEDLTPASIAKLVLGME